MILTIAITLMISISSFVFAGEVGPFDYIAGGEEWDPVVRTTWIGSLKGSFYEMGFQYGERADLDILRNSDMEWVLCKKAVGGSVADLKGRLQKYLEQIELFSPQTVEFLKGMTDGAGSQLSTSPYADEATNFERLFNLQVYVPIRYAVTPADHGCNGFWIGSQATKDGKAIATFHSQGGMMGASKWNVHHMYIMVPDDPNANIVWAKNGGGSISTGGAMFNDAGLFMGLHASGTSEYEDIAAYGVEYNLSRLHVALYSDNAEEAARMLIFGTPEYRAKTGRKTVLRTRGVVIPLSDPNTAIMVEMTARRYALRRPGDMGEKGAGYICQANNNFMEYSYDENNEKTDVPMTKYSPRVPEDSSYYRFWSPMWEIKNNYGQIDLEMVLRQLTASHKIYDKEGNELEYEMGSTFCTHKFAGGNPGGSHCPVVVVPETLEIYEVPAWPCRFVDKNWNYFNLNDYKAMR